VTLESIAEKVVPTVIVAIIMAVFGMYMRVGMLEHIANDAVNRYNDDKTRIEKKIEWLENEVRKNRDHRIVMDSERSKN
jgi:UDP-glucose 4-epimerase